MTTAMAIDEPALLALTHRMGIDWSQPLSELRRRHGTRRWFGFKDVIDVPLGALVPGIEGPFTVDWRPEDAPWPPLDYNKEFFADDPIARQGELAAALERLLGESTPNPAVNVVGATWRIGLFTVEAYAFLREKDEPLSNPLYERHPELWNRVEVVLRADHAGFVPDQDLARVAALPELASVPHREGLPVWGWFAPLIQRNPEPLRARVPPERVAVRLDVATGRLVLSARALSVVVEVERCARLLLWRAAPARSSGYARLYAEYRHPQAPEHPRRIRLLHVDRPDGLDAVAPLIAETVGRPLEIEDGFDD